MVIQELYITDTSLRDAINHLNIRNLSCFNRCFISSDIHIAGIDSSGMKIQRKGAWVQLRFQRYAKKRDFKKIHIFVDLESKKILYCYMTDGSAYESPHLKNILKQCSWLKVDVILGDGGYDSKECFSLITEIGATPGIPVRKNSIPRSRGSLSRKKAVVEQKRDIKRWKDKVQYTMRCVVESIFSGTKRRFGEFLFSLKEKSRCIEMWLRTILWNILIYPR